jgi:hypothetical protein
MQSSGSSHEIMLGFFGRGNELSARNGQFSGFWLEGGERKKCELSVRKDFQIQSVFNCVVKIIFKR